MKHEISKLMQDVSLRRRLASLTSVALIAAALVEVAAQQGVRLEREAVAAFLSVDPLKQAELGADALLVVAGHAPMATRTANRPTTRMIRELVDGLKSSDF